MPTSLLSYRQPLREAALDLAWRQWTRLGLAGSHGPGEDDFQIIDPESLLLLTSLVGRFDARLLDETMNWLRQHGRFINIQRLKSLQQHHRFGHQRVLAAMAASLRENSRLAKWRAIETWVEARSGDEPLLQSPDGSPLPNFGKSDPVFRRFGFFRGVQSPRRNATAPNVRSPDLLLVKLRALLGVNARAEILAALLTTRANHPSALARRTGYLPRSIQDILNEMAVSGHVIGERPKGSREKYFTLRPGDWDFLITWPEQRFPRWVDWAILFALLEGALSALESTQANSTLSAALQIRAVFDRHMPALSESGLVAHFSGAMRASGASFLPIFVEELATLARGEPLRTPVSARGSR